MTNLREGRMLMQTEKQLWEDRDCWRGLVDTHIKIDTSDMEEQEEKE